MTGPRVFREYDQQALDREYNNREKVPNAAEWGERFGRESARARAELPCRLDLPYGPHAGERLDVFTAPPGRPAPIHVFIHGGYWHLRDKADFSFVARAFQPAGVCTVVINYALIPDVDMDELVRQCRAAVAWVHRHARDLGGDPARITVSGHSAGGHLVAMLLSTDWPAFGAPPDVLAGGCGISGLYDLEPIRLCYLNQVLRLTPEQVQRNSPIYFAKYGSKPLVLAVGGLEGPEFHRQTEEQARAWRAQGLPCEVLDLDGHDHFSIIGELMRPDTALARAILRLIGA